MIDTRIVKQGIKFLAVGILNTGIDFGILNLLIFTFGTASGIGFSVFKGISFTAAAINSYVLNKSWTFQSKESVSTKQFTQFFSISIIGFFLNVGVASFFVNVLHPQFGLSPQLWANAGALVGTGITFVWNFTGYKFFVFKK